VNGGPRPRRPLRTRGRSSAAARAGWLRRRRIEPNQISVGEHRGRSGWRRLLRCPPPRRGRDATRSARRSRSTRTTPPAREPHGRHAGDRGRQSKTGPLFNEIPDRIADVLFLAAAGYAVTWFSWGESLGWAAAVAAVLTAYVRILGGSIGLEEHFCGPMAKPHRMAVLTAACLLSMIEVAYGYEGSGAG
jgi:hypothetical protein